MKHFLFTICFVSCSLLHQVAAQKIAIIARGGAMPQAVAAAHNQAWQSAGFTVKELADANFNAQSVRTQLNNISKGSDICVFVYLGAKSNSITDVMPKLVFNRSNAGDTLALYKEFFAKMRDKRVKNVLFVGEFCDENSPVIYSNNNGNIGGLDLQSSFSQIKNNSGGSTTVRNEICFYVEHIGDIVTYDNTLFTHISLGGLQSSTSFNVIFKDAIKNKANNLLRSRNLTDISFLSAYHVTETTLPLPEMPAAEKRTVSEFLGELFDKDSEYEKLLKNVQNNARKPASVQINLCSHPIITTMISQEGIPGSGSLWQMDAKQPATVAFVRLMYSELCGGVQPEWQRKWADDFIRMMDDDNRGVQKLTKEDNISISKLKKRAMQNPPAVIKNRISTNSTQILIDYAASFLQRRDSQQHELDHLCGKWGELDSKICTLKQDLGKAEDEICKANCTIDSMNKARPAPDPALKKAMQMFKTWTSYDIIVPPGTPLNDVQAVLAALAAVYNGTKTLGEAKRSLTGKQQLLLKANIGGAQKTIHITGFELGNIKNEIARKINEFEIQNLINIIKLVPEGKRQEYLKMKIGIIGYADYKGSDKNGAGETVIKNITLRDYIDAVTNYSSGKIDMNFTNQGKKLTFRKPTKTSIPITNVELAFIRGLIAYDKMISLFRDSLKVDITNDMFAEKSFETRVQTKKEHDTDPNSDADYRGVEISIEVVGFDRLVEIADSAWTEENIEYQAKLDSVSASLREKEAECNRIVCELDANTNKKSLIELDINKIETGFPDIQKCKRTPQPCDEYPRKCLDDGTTNAGCRCLR